MPEIHPIPAFQDNYIWAASDGVSQAIVVDPGDANPVLEWLQARQFNLSAILVTHHHPDHVGGILTLKQAYPDAVVYGPGNEAIPGRDHAVGEGDRIELLAPELAFRVLHVPGHTLGHIAFYSDTPDSPILFCGDTLFSGGCGRLFEGTPAQMLDSLDRLAALPGATRVCCAHEYTLSNLRFAQAVMPGDPAVARRLVEAQALRDAGKPTLPVPLEEERRSNVFLRIDDPGLADALNQQQPGLGREREALFAGLRGWKDNFRG